MTLENQIKIDVDYALYMARQHIEVAKESIKNGVTDLIDYSIERAEGWVETAEKMLTSDNTTYEGHGPLDN
jgi:hypothetical protein